jgi:cytochrome c-type biogenesis protein CcmH/NrfG
LAGLRGFSGKFCTFLLAALVLTAVYEYGWPAPSLSYEGAVLVHLISGVLLILLLLPVLPKLFRNRSLGARLGWALLLAGGAFGGTLIYTGDSVNHMGLFYTHIGLCVVAVWLLLSDWLGRRGWLTGTQGRAATRFAMIALVAAGIAYGAWWERTVPWQEAAEIKNPPMAPASMNQEGGGANGPFFPSSATISDAKKIPESYFLQSKTCKECHARTYDEWYQSAHHFSSFNNQWYRKAVLYMQSRVGVKPSKWCAGCHDEALLFSGNFDKPAKDILNTPAANAGIGCLVCHSISKIPSTMGQGGYVLTYPPLSRMAVSKNPIIHKLANFLIILNPEPHKRTFMKPFMHNKKQVAEFCSVCHKVHLDVPINHYRWVRGFDDYDHWQASGVSGLGARSFYYPPHPLVCTDCHMPDVRSSEYGNTDGLIHEHRFVAANTALPYQNRFKKQLDDTIRFLQSDKVSVTIFAMAPEAKPIKTTGRVTPGAPGISTAFAVGQEEQFHAPQAGVSLAPSFKQLTAPLHRANGTVQPGESVRVDVVVRTIGVGHFFPGGTVDAFDLWLELKAVDAKGHVLFWSGAAANGGNGPVDPSAEFYRSLQIDSHGNPIDKRNAYAERAVIYTHLIPPGAADTVHYLLQIPKNVVGPIHLTAKLNYRKFDWWFTQFAFAGAPDPNQKPKPSFASSYDDTRYVFTGSTAGDAGKRKGIPNLPIVVMARDQVNLQVAPAKAPRPKPKIVPNPADWQHWNDFGIGLLLQGDLKAAHDAFAELAKIAPNRPDGWNNMGRAELQEGNLEPALKLFRHAIQVDPKLASAHYFIAQILRDQGKYKEAIPYYEEALRQYPYDRVVLNQLGRDYFLQRRYHDAIRQFRKALAVDPENLSANYNLMLCYTGLGKPKVAHQFEVRYLRFKADEAAPALIGPYVRKHPNANNERQPVHEHVTIPLKYITKTGEYDPPFPRNTFH